MDQALQSYLARIAPTVSAKSAQAVIELAAEGATVPFIARYRKEKTGNLDEVQIRAVIEGHETYNEIVKRKAFLIKEIGEQNNLTAEIQKRIELSWDLGELEEIYKPFKKKKKTKATVAREAGLEPLAQWIWDLGHGLIKDDATMEMKAKAFLNPTAKIVTYEEALKGAQDILVEKIANDTELRAMVAKNYNEKGRVVAKAAKGFKPNSKYDMYKEFEEPVKNLMDAKNNHRYLAMRRGWQEEELAVDVKGDDEDILKSYEKFATSTPDNAVGEYLKQCARLALNVYVLPSVVNEVHRLLKEKADTDAITVFAENVRKLLLGSPYGSKCVLGVDPGLRTGCKVALIDKTGAFISHTVLYTLGDDAEKKAKALFGEVLKQIQIEAIAVGNGTAGRETEAFLRKVLKDLGKNIPVVMVSESGASVYSASEVAREEFPDLDVTVKGAISIARRLQDPLAELVKVDPKSIGVGQYQHDVNQSQLKKSLEAVVESCVNNVGVDVNTASAALLSHVAGIGPALAKGIVEHRKKALFSDRSELLKIPKFSTKVYEQAAGFLRIPGGKQILDSTGIHPERYQAVTDMAKDIGANLSEIIGEGAKKLLAQRTKWAQLVGEFTFDDIVKELEKPGRDPRDPFKVFQFRDDIMEVKDLQEGMICPGIVTNVTNFGAFVDIGVHQDGLVHISALSHKFVDDPRKVVNPGDHVTVKVLKVDTVKNQISLTMKMDDAPEASAPREARGDRRPDQRGAGGRPAGGPRPPHGGGGHGQRPSGPPPKPANPFNNPFAALMNVNPNKK
ncbi:helix-hairpin-helix domain-containing protein [Bdellovibrio reynosensis]|uniref:RNA-binding transcriptional accessory protein n=1 Tax=Bdellovibrio reynosensis TaxID=2835041 RepID=A0ABY4CD90_9BACT|nr:Tex family protein [Bdellovibrio reynosensis]UOF02865.1 RNA-binding transcriptional accessory protein [Bdellovibrio reynosensis]